jgi:hypothetical protein
MTLTGNRPLRLPAAVLVAALAAGLSAGPAAGRGSTSSSGTSWQLRAQVRARPGTSLSGPRTLPDAVALAHQAACGRAGDLLGDGDPRRTKIQIRLWRQAGETDATRTGAPDMQCHVRPEERSAFRLKGRVARASGWTDPAHGLHRVAEMANNLAGRVLNSGEQAWITLRLGSREKPVRAMIRSLARRHGLSVSTALRVAGCESRFNRRAYSYPYAGVFQQDLRYWPRRAAHFGHRGASPFDAHANIDVSLKMARSMGWGHWGCG